jgi:hypothetical protein
MVVPLNAGAPGGRLVSGDVTAEISKVAPLAIATLLELLMLPVPVTARVAACVPSPIVLAPV